MAYPTSVGTFKVDRLAAYRGQGGRLGNLKNHCINVRDESLAGPIDAKRVLDVMVFSSEARDYLNQTLSATGLEQYIRDTTDNQTFDLTAESTAVINACQAIVDWVVTNFPAGTGPNSAYILALEIQATGKYRWRQIDSASLAGLRTLLDNLIATLD